MCVFIDVTDVTADYVAQQSYPEDPTVCSDRVKLLSAPQVCQKSPEKSPVFTIKSPISAFS